MYYILAALAIVVLVAQQQAMAQSFSKDAPLTVQQLQNGTIDRNLSIDPTEPLPLNGTVTTDTAGITDTDMNSLPPVGISVIIQNGTVTVTNLPITLESPASSTDTGGGSSSGSDESSDEDEES